MPSESDWIKIRCPACGTEQSVFAVQKIDAAEDLASRQMLYRGELNIFPCVQCRKNLHWNEYLLYSDKDKGLLINVFPEEQEPHRDRLCRKLLSDLGVVRPADRRPNYLLFGYAALARMVALVEERAALKNIRNSEDVEESLIYRRLFLAAEEWLNVHLDSTFDEKFAEANPLFEEGYRYHKAAAFEKALSRYGEALLKCPNHFSARHNQGLIFLNELGAPEKALESFQACRALRPNDGGLLFTLGRLFFRLKRASEAAACLRNSVLVAPEEYMPWYQLGIVVLRLGETAEGLAHLETSLALTHDADDRAAIEEAIRQVSDYLNSPKA